MSTGARVGLGFAIGGISIVLIGAVAVSIVAATGGFSSIGSSSTPPNPLAGDSFYVNPASTAQVAAEADGTGAFDAIANTPAATWLLPEQHGLSTVQGYVAGISQAATTAGKTPIYVVYGIPNRDCGNLSAGGSSAADYPAWVAAISAGIGADHAVVILEPDSLALSVQCNNTDERVGELRSAIAALKTSAATVYLDGGHSSWLPASQMATLLKDVGLADVRGFATNVSNYNATADEIAYGEKVSELTGGAHFVIDVSRNGKGSNGEWCNPAGRGLGTDPHVVTDGTALDAELWIKNPGESDGTCNGGPAAGVWWPDRARALIAAR